MNTVALNTNDLCNRYGDWKAIDMVMSHWERTSSPLAYWFRQMSSENYERRAEKLNLAGEREILIGRNMSYGLPTKEALRVCRSDNDLTTNITSPVILIDNT